MKEIQPVRKLLLRRVTVATGAGLLAVVAGLGMAPAGADDDFKLRAEVEVKVGNPGNPDDVSRIVAGPGGTGSL